jgi:predicted RNase H-like HicB family nuclease
MMANYIYPAVFHAEEVGGYSVKFPDLLGCVTEGDSLAEAFEMAQDALGIYLYSLEQDGEEYPKPSNPANIHLENGDFTALFEWDRITYLKKTDNKAVKKTLTIPSWLNSLAEEKNVNFSQILQSALMEKLVNK